MPAASRRSSVSAPSSASSSGRRLLSARRAPRLRRSRAPVLSRQHYGVAHGELLTCALCRCLHGHRDGHAGCENLQKRQACRVP